VWEFKVFFTFCTIHNSNTGVLLYGASVGDVNVVWTVLLIRSLDVLKSCVIPETSYFDGTSSWFTQFFQTVSIQYIKLGHSLSFSQFPIQYSLTISSFDGVQ